MFKQDYCICDCLSIVALCFAKHVTPPHILCRKFKAAATILSQRFLKQLQFSHTLPKWFHTFPVYLICRMDENYNILPHGVNFQDAIFPDTTENRRTFSSLFQFSNCTQGSQPFHTFSPEWDTQEDNRVGRCSRLTARLFMSSMSNVWVSETKPIKRWAQPCSMIG